MKTFSVEHQKKLAERIGYDYSKWNPDDPVQCNLLYYRAIVAQISGEDTHGNPLSENDLEPLSIITGRE
jgi:hypothetical protein